MQLLNPLVHSCLRLPEKPFTPPSLRTWGVNKHVSKPGLALKNPPNKTQKKPT